MENTFKELNLKRENYRQEIIETLSGYEERTIHEDGSVTTEWVETEYFLENDTWNINFFGQIKNFKEEYKNYKGTTNLKFYFNNSNINLEVKYFCYTKLFSSALKLSSLFVKNANFRRLAKFLNEKYPTNNSILNLDIKKAEFDWINWLENNDVKTVKEKKSESSGKKYTVKKTIANLLKRIYTHLFKQFDKRDEWVKDIWDARNLKDFGVQYNLTRHDYYICFQKIKNKNLKKEIKRYCKRKLLNDQLSWATVKKYCQHLTTFFDFISNNNPTWNDLKKISRKNIANYIAYLNQYIAQNKDITNPDNYIKRNLIKIKKFLSEIKKFDYEIAPEKPIETLIYPSDKPRQKKKANDSIDYIPESIQHQLKNNLNKLSKEVQLVVLTMLETGLRISDALTLKRDCLELLDGKYQIKTDIKKTKNKNHKIPITNELANMLAAWINKHEEKSNNFNNPQNYLFCRYRGERKKKPYSQRWINRCLNKLARQQNIKNENGDIYHFKNHAFRHTYGVKMINNGVDILIVQELMAHASPEMTQTYAKIVDDTKRKAFEKAVNNGAFTFTKEGELIEDPEQEIDEETMDMLWTNHKLEVVDTPYGTCVQRANGSCTFAKEPPCLTCNGGTPCKDLLITEDDKYKYETLIEYKEKLVKKAEEKKREGLANTNKKVLNQLKEILEVLEGGNIIYGRNNRLISETD